MSELIFFGRVFKAVTRTLEQMKKVIYDRGWLRKAEPKMGLYFMYRNLYRSRKELIQMRKFNVRYDITIIPPRNLGKEFVKTFGHYHPIIEGTRVTYPEIYEVLEGKAHFLLQKKKNEKIEDVVVVKAGKGDKIVVPPNYGHVTINPSSQILKMANWVAMNFSSEYESIKAKRGAAYFELVEEKWIENENYDEVPRIRFVKPLKIHEKGIYNLIQAPKTLNFLTNPCKFKELFTWINNEIL